MPSYTNSYEFASGSPAFISAALIVNIYFARAALKTVFTVLRLYSINFFFINCLVIVSKHATKCFSLMIPLVSFGSGKIHGTVVSFVSLFFVDFFASGAVKTLNLSRPSK
jgi:hypothetical protein